MTNALIRSARREDTATILRLIRELAEFENLFDQVQASEEDILRDGFGSTPRFECLLAEINREAVGFALFFFNYSTFEGRAGLYLEDLYVSPKARGASLGQAIMTRLAGIAVERGCTRFDLSVLHWNQARAFYDKLGFRHQEDWLPYRLAGAALTKLAEEDRA